MDKAIEIAAKVNYENWGGSWRSATEDRKMQSRKEVIKILECIFSDYDASKEIIGFLIAEQPQFSKELIKAARSKLEPFVPPNDETLKNLITAVLQEAINERKDT